MSIHTKQLKNIITRVLTDMELQSPAAIQLLLGTAAVESNLGTYLQQIKGPALGVFQMEPTTLIDIWANYLAYRPLLVDKIKSITNRHKASEYALEVDIGYQIAMARVHYLRAPEALPKENGIEGLAYYWKRYYNTSQGRGSIEHFINSYFKYVEGPV